jgi:UDP-N-acetylglucosamine 4,6-dehydratase
VRYGNVVGSRGSVIPIFQTQIKAGKPLTITHKDMTRFWITMDEAIDMVLLAIKQDEGKCIYVPKIPSMRIVDLAEAMDPGGKRVFTGIRPGEKIHECLITEDEARFTTEYDQYYVITPADPPVLKLPFDFRYTSDTNPSWVEASAMMEAV